MAQMPEIKGVVNKEPERDKKKGGLFGRLFGGGGSSSGLGGFGGGAGGGLGGGLAGGGILATKAGLLALILVGTTVAGGIGMLGYRLFGPGSDGSGSGDNLALFAPKPKDAQNADGQGAAKDGASESLKQFNEANKTPAAGDAAASATPTDATAANAAGGAAAAAAGADGPINKMGDASNGVNKNPLKNVAKFGALSSGSGGGGGASAASSGAKSASADMSAASKGNLSNTKKTGAATIIGGTARAFGGTKGIGAAQQAFGVRSTMNGAGGSSASLGAGYDGANTGGSNISGAGTPIGGAAGVAAGTPGAAQPTALNGPNSVNTSANVPTPLGAPAAPWQSQIQEAQALIGVAAALLLVCSLINKTPSAMTLTITKLIGAAVAAIGMMVALIGGTIAHGKYGQGVQGAMLGAAGAGLILAGVMAATSQNNPTKPAAGANTTPGALTNSMFGNSGLGAMNTFVMLGGGLAIVGLVGTMMVPPTKYPAQDANDPNWPKGGLIGYQQQPPSEQALKQMVA